MFKKNIKGLPFSFLIDGINKCKKKNIKVKYFLHQNKFFFSIMKCEEETAKNISSIIAALKNYHNGGKLMSVCTDIFSSNISALNDVFLNAQAKSHHFL